MPQLKMLEQKISIEAVFNMLFICSIVSCTFSCTMKYLVRDCDPNTGEPDDDGYDDEYVVRYTHPHSSTEDKLNACSV